MSSILRHMSHSSRLKLTFFLILIPLACLLMVSHQGKIFFSRFFSTDDSKHLTSRLSEEDSLYKSFSLHPKWQVFDKTQMQAFDVFRPTTAKVVFELLDETDGPFYIVAKKKSADDMSKHRRWEFPGGRLNKSENVLEAVSRELFEEDDSGILQKVFNKHLVARVTDADTAEEERILFYRNIELDTGEHQTIFKAKILKEEWLSLDHFWKLNQVENNEVFRYKAVPIDSLNLSQSVKKKWTPKSRKILEALFKE